MHVQIEILYLLCTLTCSTDRVGEEHKMESSQMGGGVSSLHPEEVIENLIELGMVWTLTAGENV